MYCVRRIALDTRLITHTGVGTYIRTVFGGLPQAGGGDYTFVAVTNLGLPTLPGIPAVPVRSRPLNIGTQLLPWELRRVPATGSITSRFSAPTATARPTPGRGVTRESALQRCDRAAWPRAGLT